MKIPGILVMSVIIKLHINMVFRHIFSQYMEVSSNLVISVIIKLHRRAVLRHIFSLNMFLAVIL